MQHRLALPAATVELSSFAVNLDLGYMSLDGLPALDLPFIILAAASHVVATVPLKPSARIFPVKPALLSPHRQGLRSIHAEEVQLRIMSLMAELRLRKPTLRKLLTTVRHILPAKNPKLEHLLRRQLGFEIGMKVLPFWFG